MLLLSSLILSSSSRRGETRRSSPTTATEEDFGVTGFKVHSELSLLLLLLLLLSSSCLIVAFFQLVPLNPPNPLIYSDSTKKKTARKIQENKEKAEVKGTVKDSRKRPRVMMQSRSGRGEIGITKQKQQQQKHLLNEPQFE